jgi:serine/threonine-protein kinase SRPK3
VALKIQKSAPHYTEAAIDEITILKQIAAEDPDDTKGVVKLLDHFKHTGSNGQHICMVFEFLGDNLLTLIKLYKYRGLPLHMVKELTSQVLVGLDFLHRQLSIIHTDLKPENVLLVAPLDPSKDPRKSGLLETVLHSSGKSGTDSSAGVEEGYKETGSLTKNKKKKLKRRARKAGITANINGNANGIRPSVASDTTQADIRLNASIEVCSTADAVQPTVDPLQPSLPVADHEDEAAGSSTVSEFRTSEVAGNSPKFQNSSSGVTKTKAEAVQIEPTRSEVHLSLADTVGEGIDLKCKIVDLGNACWSYNQFTNDIQTRQYRCPEAILGAKYSHSADIWSFACIVFELATGDVLFDPRSGDDFDRDEVTRTRVNS